MVANLSAHKRGWDDRWEIFSNWAEKGKKYHDQLIRLVDEDTKAFNAIMEAFGLPKKTVKEKKERTKAIQEATRQAIEVPVKVMQLCYESMEVMRAMAEIGNPNSVSDAGVGALAARSGVMGAFLNVKINAAGYRDRAYVEKILAQGEELQQKAMEMEEQILEIVNREIGGGMFSF
jgi:glutamate formiminotransferase/formiminotetrahydrofolate cyclodeaminase